MSIKTISRTITIIILFCMCVSGNNSFAESKQAQYDYIAYSQNGIREVIKNNQKGCIDEEGNVIIEVGDKFYMGNAGGYILTHEKAKYKAVNIKDGRIVYFDNNLRDDEYITYYDGNHGFAMKQSNGLYALVDELGKPLTPFQYDNLWVVEGSESLNTVGAILNDSQKGERIGYLNWDGSVKLPFEYRKLFGGLAKELHQVLIRIIKNMPFVIKMGNW